MEMNNVFNDVNVNKPVAVSISCITYNQRDYIRDCFEGFLMQKTTFPVEILVHDDASTDGTQDIILEYSQKYPHLFKPILRQTNLYSQGDSFVSKYNFEQATGKYIAICEGDDFWTHPYKLQKQFDFMESHPEYSLCGHQRRVLNHIHEYYMINNDKYKKPSSQDDQRFDVLTKQYYTTQTLFFRKESLMSVWDKLLQNTKGYLMADTQLIFYLSLVGKLHYIGIPMATYRVASKSLCSYDNFEKFKALLQSAYQCRLMLANEIGRSDWTSVLTSAYNQALSSQINNDKFNIYSKIKNWYWKIKKYKAKKNYMLYLNSTPVERVKMFCND